MYILGIESTCDETAAAIIDYNESIISNIVISQINIHKEYGGVVPEIASRNHIENIYPLMDKLFQNASKKISINDISHIAYASEPGLIGGLLVGKNFCKGISKFLNIPLIPVNHLYAHLMMPFMFYKNIKFPNLALLISGGHSEFSIINSFYDIKKISHTIDDSVGESFDKVAKMLGIEYPGGPNIEKLAKSGNKHKFKFPMPLIGPKFNENSENYLNFSFSGLKTAINIFINKISDNNPKKIDNQTKSDICASFQQTILDILIYKISLHLVMYPHINDIVISGGVASNQFLINNLIDKFSNKNIYVPPLKFCTDNGLMISYAGLLLIKKT